MKIHVMSRINLERLLKKQTLDDKCAVISIIDPINTYSTPTHPIVLDPHHTCHFLSLSFHDQIHQHEPQDGYILFDEETAKIVAEFITSAIKDDVQDIICQCTAGICRSAGMAAAISQFYTGESGEYFKRYVPNTLVYKLMLMALNK